MDKTESSAGRRWRIFAPDYMRGTGTSWLTLFAIFGIALAFSIITFQQYGEILARPILGIQLAGLLLLRKRESIYFLATTIGISIASYLYLDTGWYKAVLYSSFTAAEAMLAAMLTRRYCGARVDFSRPVRMAAFFVYALLPATVFRALLEVITNVGFLHGISDNLATMLASHFVAMGLITPLIVIACRDRHRFSFLGRSPKETIALFALLLFTCAFVFSQLNSPFLFLMFLPLAWISYRLSLFHGMVSAAIVIFVAGIATAEGIGPIAMLHQLNLPADGIWQGSKVLTITVLQVFSASTLAVVLPLGVLRAEELRLEAKVKRTHKHALAALNRVREGERELRHLAMHDRETGLLSRPGLKTAIGELLQRRRGALLHVATLSIERYSSFQSVLGTARTGEMVMRAGYRIAEFLPNAPIARISPDALTVAFFSSDRHAAREILERLSTLFMDPVTIEDSHIDMQFAIGVTYGVSGDDPVQLVQQSETAVVQARKMSLPLAFYDPHAEQQAAGNLTILSDLRAGLDTGAVWMSFQPKMDLKTSRIESAECLIRWNHPVLGAVGPDKFIPLAEETGFIHPLTDWVIEQAINGQKLLDAKGIHINMAVNISVRSLCDLQFTSHVMGIFERCNADPKRFTLELTESAIMVRTRESLVTLKCLRERGFSISIDDFGTGQSSLAYLRHLPADELKIDRSFITDLATDKRDQKLVHSTIELAHSLDLKIVAEGVEDEVALAVRTRSGCDTAQGYHVARPMDIDKLAAMLAPRKSPPLSIDDLLESDVFTTNEASNGFSL